MANSCRANGHITNCQMSNRIRARLLEPVRWPMSAQLKILMLVKKGNLKKLSER